MAPDLQPNEILFPMPRPAAKKVQRPQGVQGEEKAANSAARGSGSGSGGGGAGCCEESCEFSERSKFFESVLNGEHTLRYGLCDLCFEEEKLRNMQARNFRVTLENLLVMDNAARMGIYQVVELPESQAAFFCFQCAVKIRKNHPGLRLQLHGPQMLLNFLLQRQDWRHVEEVFEQQAQARVQDYFSALEQLLRAEWEKLHHPN